MSLYWSCRKYRSGNNSCSYGVRIDATPTLSALIPLLTCFLGVMSRRIYFSIESPARKSKLFLHCFQQLSPSHSKWIDGLDTRLLLADGDPVSVQELYDATLRKWNNNDISSWGKNCRHRIIRHWMMDFQNSDVYRASNNQPTHIDEYSNCC